MCIFISYNVGPFILLCTSSSSVCFFPNSPSSDSAAPRDSVPVPGKHSQVCVQQLRGASPRVALAEERQSHQAIQTGEDPEPRGPAHQPAGSGGCGLLPVHSRQRAGHGLCHSQADSHREGRSAQPSASSVCHSLLQHIRPAHLGETRVQLGPNHRLLSALPARCGLVLRFIIQ